MKKILWFSGCVAVLVAGITLSNTASVASNNNKELQKQQPIQTIDQVNALPITMDNSFGSELFIQDAKSKEVSGTQYRMLTGEESDFTSHSTYPDVTVVNRSTKTIKSFALIVRSLVDKDQRGYVIIKYNVALTPGSTYTVTAREWPMAERKTVQKDEKFVNVAQQPSVDSAKAWLSGSVNDLKVTVGLVEYEDGTRWIIANVKW
jgi:hypothetical protein